MHLPMTVMQVQTCLKMENGIRLVMLSLHGGMSLAGCDGDGMA
jgi:hypothetical protein